MEIRQARDVGAVIYRSQLRRAEPPSGKPQALDTEPPEIRCPVPVHSFLPAPDRFSAVMGPPDDTPSNRESMRRDYEKSKQDVMDPRFPDDPDFKRAYLLMWQDWGFPGGRRTRH